MKLLWRNEETEKPGGKPSVSTPVQPSSIFCQGLQICHKHCRPNTFKNLRPIFKKTHNCNYLPDIKMKLMWKVVKLCRENFHMPSIASAWGARALNDHRGCGSNVRMRRKWWCCLTAWHFTQNLELPLDFLNKVYGKIMENLGKWWLG